MLWPVIEFGTDYTARRLFSSCRIAGVAVVVAEVVQKKKKGQRQRSRRELTSVTVVYRVHSTETKWQCGQSDSSNFDTAESGQKTYTGL